MADPTIEKDVDLSTDRDVSRGVERSSYTGSDDKTKSFGSTTNLDNKVDVGEAEHAAAGLAKFGSTSDDLVRLAQLQYLSQQGELFDRRTRREDELATIRQRQLSNSADYDQQTRELYTSHAKSRNSQDVRHQDVAADRVWNVDEQGYQVAKVLEGLGVDHRAVFAIMLDALAKSVKG